MPLRCDTRFEKGEEKKFAKKTGLKRVDRVKKMEWHTIYHLHHWSWCVNSLCCSCFGSSCTSSLTDVSSSQRWVIYSQTNGAVLNYTYLFWFVWYIVVFSDLFFFQIPYHLNVAAEIETHQTRQSFSNLLLFNFGEPVRIVASISCS